MPQPKGKKVKKNVESELSVEDGEVVQVEEIELEPPTLEMEKPMQTGDESEEQAGERPIQMGDQPEKPEPEKATGSIDMNVIMTMFQRIEEKINKNTNNSNEKTEKKFETLIGSLREDNNKNRQEQAYKEENNKNRQEEKEELDKKIESLREYITCLLYTSRCV